MEQKKNLIFSITIFWGSTLLFCVEPMLGKTLLPTFGGVSGVWTICLAAYQILLLAGSYYAEKVGNVRERAQYLIHIALILLAALWTFSFSASYHPLLTLVTAGGMRPEFSALAAVFLAIGLPFIILGAGASLLQHWAVKILGGGRETYRLYAISNLGSFVGLFIFPFLLEPYVSVRWQWRLLAIGLAAYGSLFAICGRAFFVGTPAKEDHPTPALHLTSRHFLWLFLPALTTGLLNAVTTHIACDLPPTPLAWVLLLGAFLLSFALGFSRIGEKLCPAWGVLGGFVLLSALFSFLSGDLNMARMFVVQFGTGILLLLLCGTFLNAWLCSVRPENENELTRFYLFIAIGGAIGGVCSSLLPPIMFRSILEFPIVLAIVAGATVYYFQEKLQRVGGGEKSKRSPLLFGGLAAIIILSFCATSGKKKTLAIGRSFYGNWSVEQDQITFSGGGQPIPIKTFSHGNTLHGYERTDMEDNEPTAYFGQMGGGLAFSLNKKYSGGEPIHCGIMGMGIGTLAYYGREGDTVRFFELDGQVVDVAEKYFSYCKKSRGEIDTVVGDGRKSLEMERGKGERRYDVLIIDAYNGDSLPYHLITEQAFQLYLDRLEKDGTLALNITNWYVDLLPICKAIAKRFDLNVLGVESPDGAVTRYAKWIFFSREKLAKPDYKVTFIDWGHVRDIQLPADERGSILPFLQFKQIFENFRFGRPTEE